jgi:hypothetical protein
MKDQVVFVGFSLQGEENSRKISDGNHHRETLIGSLKLSNDDRPKVASFRQEMRRWGNI